MAGFDPVVAAITRQTEWIKHLYAYTVAVHSADHRAPQMPPEDWPRTAFDEVRDLDKIARHRDRVAMMLGG